MESGDGVSEMLVRQDIVTHGNLSHLSEQQRRNKSQDQCSVLGVVRYDRATSFQSHMILEKVRVGTSDRLKVYSSCEGTTTG